MKKIELRKVRILKRVFNGSVATSFARALRSTITEAGDKSDLRGYSEELAERYVNYYEQKRSRLQVLGLETQRAEVVDFVRRRNYV